MQHFSHRGAVARHWFVFLDRGTPYPCREAGFYVRESVAVRAQNGFAIFIAHGRKRGLSTNLDRSHTRHAIE
jgi:hypothetical protein